MKILSNLGLICFSILGCSVSYATAPDTSINKINTGYDADIDTKNDVFSPEDWYYENKLQDEYKGLKPNSSYKAVSDSKLSDGQSDISANSAPIHNLTVSDAVIFEVLSQPDQEQLQQEKKDEDEFHSNIIDFFNKYKNPEYLVIFECDGITQTIHALNAEKAFVNSYWERNKNLKILSKANKWIGISYGGTLAGANVGTLIDTENIDEFNFKTDSILNQLKKDRIGKSKRCFTIMNCLFNSCVSCVKLKAEKNDIDIIRASQFDQSSPSAIQNYIANYFPVKVDEKLIFLQSGKDRRRIDPDYQKSYVSIINNVNETAKANKKAVIKKNFGAATDMIATVMDTIKIPVAGTIVGGVGNIVTNSLKFKPIDDTQNCDVYKEMSNEVLARGTVKLIINIDNYDDKDVIPNLQIEYKPQCNKLKYRLTINIPSTQYQDKKYDFNDGYDRITWYLKNEKTAHYLNPLYDFINNMHNVNE